jgi:exodeoxyribonuclease VII small subunit
VSNVAGRLHALSPLAVLSRGYAVARDATGATLGSATDFAPALDFDLLLARRHGASNRSLGASRAAHHQRRPMSYETDLARIENIVGELERSEIPLDDALRLFEEGIERLRTASSALMQAEARVRKLIEDTDGGFTLADFES